MRNIADKTMDSTRVAACGHIHSPCKAAEISGDQTTSLLIVRLEPASTQQPSLIVSVMLSGHRSYAALSVSMSFTAISKLS